MSLGSHVLRIFALSILAVAGTIDAVRVPAANARPRALAAEDLILDCTPAAQLLQLWQADGPVDRDRARALAADAPYRAVRDFVATQMNCAPSDDQVAASIVAPSTAGVCGFGLDPAYQERASLDSLLHVLVERNAVLRGRVARDVAVYVPAATWQPIRVWFVVASRWMFDAVTRSPNLVIFNLTEALGYGEDTESRAAIVERVLAHETFHAALRQMESGRPGWSAYHEPQNAYEHIARVMLDEGVAHYIDWRGRPGADTLFTARPGVREKKAFDQLKIACKGLGSRNTDRNSRAEILALASTGPVWSKYGAISGMFAAWRVERAWGADSLRAVVEEGPMALLRGYAAVAESDTSLTPLPKELLVK